MIYRTVKKVLGIAGCALLLWLPAAGCAQPGTDAPAADVKTKAREIAADYAETKASEVEILSVEAVEFSDSSLGCPEPDMAYLAVITPGYKVIVKVGSQQLDIRIAGQHGRVCEQPRPASPKR